MHRKVWHLDYVSQFTADIHHLSRKENTVAKTFSWFNINTFNVTTSNDLNRLAKAQQADDEVQNLRASTTLLKFSEVPLPISEGTSQFGDLFIGPSRPYVPDEFKRAVFDASHNRSHPGIRAMQRLVTQRFVWCDVNRDVRNLSRACLQCHREKIYYHTATPFWLPVPVFEATVGSLWGFCRLSQR